MFQRLNDQEVTRWKYHSVNQAINQSIIWIPIKRPKIRLSINKLTSHSRIRESHSIIIQYICAFFVDMEKNGPRKIEHKDILLFSSSGSTSRRNFKKGASSTWIRCKKAHFVRPHFKAKKTQNKFTRRGPRQRIRGGTPTGEDNKLHREKTTEIESNNKAKNNQYPEKNRRKKGKEDLRRKREQEKCTPKTEVLEKGRDNLRSELIQLVGHSQHADRRNKRHFRQLRRNLLNLCTRKNSRLENKTQMSEKNDQFSR